MSDILPLPKLRTTALDLSQLDAAAEFLHRTWRETYRHDLPAGLLAERTLEYFRDYLRDRLNACWLAWFDRRLVGLASVSANCIEDLWVSRRYRRRGIGSQLLAVALEELRRRDFAYAQVGCEGFNRDAVRFFQARDWTLIAAETQELTPALHVEALVFSLPLRPAAATQSPGQ